MTQEKIDVKTLIPEKLPRGRPVKAISDAIKDKKLQKMKDERREKFLEEHPQYHNLTREKSIPMVQITPSNAGEVLLAASQKVISLYNQLADSIEEKDFKKLTIKERINALQKLSYIHIAQKKMKPASINFIKLDVKNSSPDILEKALLEFNQEGGEEDEN